MTDGAKRIAQQTTEATATNPDPFDLASLRLDQSFVETAGVKKLRTTVPVGKPNPQDFVRVHPSPEYRDTFAAIELREDSELYLVVPRVAVELPGEFVSIVLFTAINRQSVVRLWPVKLPGPDGRINEWYRSLGEAAERAIDSWVRVKANRALGAYEIFEAVSSIADPEWPTESSQDLLRIAFRDRIVTSLDHPLVNRLRGKS